MTSLIACMSTGKGTWGHVSGVIKSESWDKVYLISSDYFKDKITIEDNFELIVINMDKSTVELVEDIKATLKGKIRDTEVALNLISGSGKEHMAILSALLKLGLAIRQVVLTKEGVKEI